MFKVSKRDLKLFSQVRAGGAPNIIGAWENELGSVMTIQTVNNDGTFSGAYVSQVSGHDQPVSGLLIGAILGDAIGFVVSWAPMFASTTSWSGMLLAAPSGTLYIYTLWNLSQGAGDSADWWENFLAGADLFWQRSS